MKPKSPLEEALSKFGSVTKVKLSGVSAAGAPEDQLRAPLETPVCELSVISGLPSDAVVMIGEATPTDLKVRPDHAVNRRNALIGFIEVKAPGKGADPRKFSDKHDQEQWKRIKSPPKLIYTSLGTLVRVLDVVDWNKIGNEHPEAWLYFY